MQRRPAGPGVDPGGQARIPGDLGLHPGGVAEDYRGGDVVAGQFRGGGQHPHGAAGPVADAGLAEHLRLPGQVGAAGLDGSLEPGPAGEAVLAGQGQLRAGQGRLGGYRPDAADGRGVARLRGAQQVAGLVAQVVQAGAGRKIGHDVSFTGLRSARRADKGDRRELRCGRTEVDYVLPADPEAPSRAYRHRITEAQGHPRGLIQTETCAGSSAQVTPGGGTAGSGPAAGGGAAG